MKPDSELYESHYNFRQNTPITNKSQLSLPKPSSRQKLIPSLSSTLKQQVDQAFRQQWISEAAYFKALARNFSPGSELTDWLEAEQDYIETLVDMFLLVCKEDGHMNLTGLQQLAKAIGIENPEKINSQLELIRKIQTANNERPCFKTSPSDYCHSQTQCQWKTECQKLVAEWCR